MAGKSADPYLPCPNRREVCRRGGCREAATNHIVQLCPGHLVAYEHECWRVLALARRTYPSKPSSPSTTSLSNQPKQPAHSPATPPPTAP
jgi:hypothetical protein